MIKRYCGNAQALPLSETAEAEAMYYKESAVLQGCFPHIARFHSPNLEFHVMYYAKDRDLCVPGAT